MYDGRVGRWMTTDPYSQYHSPYLAMGNNPIGNIDPDGGRDVYYNNDGSHSHTKNWLVFWKINRYWGEGETSVSQGKFWAMSDQIALHGGTVNASSFEYVGPEKLDWVDDWAAKTDLLGSFSYDLVNSTSVILQSLVVDPNLNQLNGDGITHGSWEHQQLGFEGLSNIVPQAKMATAAVVLVKRVPKGQKWIKLGQNAGELVLKKPKGQLGGTYVKEAGAYLRFGGDELHPPKLPGSIQSSRGKPYSKDNFMYEYLQNCGRVINGDIDVPGM
jgi:hypothetical protein